MSQLTSQAAINTEPMGPIRHTLYTGASRPPARPDPGIPATEKSNGFVVAQESPECSHSRHRYEGSPGHV